MAKQMQVAFFKTGLKGVAHVAGWLYLAPWSIMEHPGAQHSTATKGANAAPLCPNPLAGPENSERLPCLAGGTGGQLRIGQECGRRWLQVAFFKIGLKGVAHVAGWLYLAP